MRLFLALILCLAIPFQGIARAHAIEPPCPMAQFAADLSAADQVAHAMTMIEHDCCNDADSVAKTGKLCKTGQECKVGQSVALAAPVRLTPDRVPTQVAAHLPALLPPSHPPSVWRPPALV